MSYGGSGITIYLYMCVCVWGDSVEVGVTDDKCGCVSCECPVLQFITRPHLMVGGSMVFYGCRIGEGGDRWWSDVWSGWCRGGGVKRRVGVNSSLAKWWGGEGGRAYIRRVGTGHVDLSVSLHHCSLFFCQAAVDTCGWERGRSGVV